MRRPTATRLGRAALLLLAALVIAGLAALGRGLLDPAIGPLLDPPDPLLIAALLAGVALLGAGCIALAAGIELRPGALAILAGAAWFAGGLGRMAHTVPGTRSVGEGATVLVLPLLLTLLVVLADRTPEAGSRRRLRAFLAVAVSVAGLTVLAYRPYDDPRCPEHCFELTALVESGQPGRLALTVAQLLVAGTAAVGLVAIGRRGVALRAGAGPSRLVHLGGVLAGLAMIGWLALGALVAVVGWVEPISTERRFGALGGATAMLAGRTPDGLPALRLGAEAAMATLVAGVACIGVGTGWRALRTAEARTTMRRLADGIASAPSSGELTGVLARALHDPGLRVTYRVADPHADGPGTWLVDAGGSPVELGPCPADRTRTPIVRDGVELAIVEHRTDIDPAALRDGLGASALVALDSERLGAARLAQLHELRASRARIVDVQDAVRRRIERDVHDGAQQRLLAIAFRLRLVRMEAEASGRTEAAHAMERAEASALALVDELRRICRGIHPQALAEGGLEHGLRSLADDAPMPMQVRVEPGPRPPARVEVAVYETVKELLGVAGVRGAARLSVAVSRADGRVLLEVDGPAPEAPAISERLSDRLGAAGAEVTTGSAAGDRWLRAVLPCA